jgi:hypothetical protein
VLPAGCRTLWAPHRASPSLCCHFVLGLLCKEERQLDQGGNMDRPAQQCEELERGAQQARSREEAAELPGAATGPVDSGTTS